VHALLQFEQGATVTLSASWDVWAHRHPNIDLYGRKGSIYVPDPNFFGGEVLVAKEREPAEALPAWDHPFGIPNQEHSMGKMANYRTAGLADMAVAIMEGRDNRCSLDRTLHGVDVMVSILKSGETGAFVDLSTTCSRPAALGIAEAQALLV
jgi:predicted dehydrogenase